MASARIGIDTGGTFTDLLLFDVDHGTISSLKVASTPQEPLSAFMASIRDAEAAPEDIAFLQRQVKLIDSNKVAKLLR